MKKYFRNEILSNDLYHVEYQPGVKLNQNESPWDVPLELKVQITERLIKTDWNRYPVDDDYKQIKETLAREHGVLPNQVVLSNGSNTIIQALVNIISPTSKIILLDPSFSVYELQANLHGNKVIKVPLSEDFELLTEKTISTIKKERPGLVMIANPNSPTGTLFDKKSLYRIIQTANCPVVIDEAYFYFTAETVMEWMSEFDNLIILRSLSKAMALAGVRFGYAITHYEIAHNIEKFLIPYRMSRITCITVEEILKNPTYVTEYTQNIVKERGRLFSKLQTIEGVRVFPSEAIYLLLKIENASAIAQKLMEENVLVRNIDNGTTLKDCLRVTVGTPDENDTFLMTLKKVKNELKKPVETEL